MASSSSSEPVQDPVVHVEFRKGVNGLDMVILRELAGSSVEVYLHGAQVTSWKNDRKEEQLFVSKSFCPFPKAPIVSPPKPIRGGIQICFPQFGGGLLRMEKHGFARSRLWSVDTDPPPRPKNTSIKAFVDLILKAPEEKLIPWPHKYEFRLRVTLGPGGDLMLTSRVRNINTDGKPFSFTFAYHTYFNISDISEIRAEGLETMDYFDNLKNKERFTEQGDALTFEEEVDKVYLSTVSKIAIVDHERKKTYVLRKDGLPDAVIWNPWDKKAKAIPDLGDKEYRQMLVSGAAAKENPITLKPGEEWKGRQEISAVFSSYCSGPLDPQQVIGAYK